jgi:DNA-binding NarL/FixJ family response regulator
MELNEPYRIVIADDHAVVRRGVRAILESQPGITICAEASDGLETVDSIKKEKPDLLLLDLTMPEMNGLEVIRTVREESPSTDILVLTMHFSEELARECLSFGAHGYILKSDADTELLAAVDSLRYHGRPYFTCQRTMTMTDTFARASVSGVESAIAGPTLTARELDVLQLLASGKSNKEAAGVLDVSTRTIESHRNRIMKKMNFDSFSDLVRFAVSHNLIDA